MTTPAARTAPTGPVLRPMRAVTYRPADGRPLAAVTMSPVEVWDDAAARRLAATRPEHVLHVVAPDTTPLPTGGGTASPPPGAGGTLSRWLSQRVVTRAERPALYVWAWEVEGRRVAGIVGAVDLPAGGFLRAHEGVRADVVATRAAQLGAAAVQAEPVVALHDGVPLGLGEAGSEAPAVVDLTLPGERHRIWPVRDPERTRAIRRTVEAAGAPVVADGHHRLTALDTLAEAVPGAVRRAMVLVVDVAASDLVVGSIHRVVPGLSLDTVRSTPGSRVVSLAAGTENDYLAGAAPGELRWVIASGGELDGLAMRVEEVHARYGNGGAGCAPVAQDACLLHSHLLPAWGVFDTAVDYLHDWGRARASVRAVSGVAIRTSAPALHEIFAAARAGQLLPPKATSIGPKPRIGLLMLDSLPVAVTG